MSPQDFRARHRDYGEFVPSCEIERALLNGWELIVDPHETRDGALMRPPAAQQPEAA